MEDWAETWALSSHHGYGRNRVFFFWFECKTYWKTKEMKTKTSFDPITLKILKSLLKPVCRYLLLK
jgi:hypothetical protein